MGSQAEHDALHEAPAAIVVKLGERRYRIAQRVQAAQVDRYGGGRGSVVVTYELAPGLPYITEQAAREDATLILKRSER